MRDSFVYTMFIFHIILLSTNSLVLDFQYTYFPILILPPFINTYLAFLQTAMSELIFNARSTQIGEYSIYIYSYFHSSENYYYYYYSMILLGFISLSNIHYPYLFCLYYHHFKFSCTWSLRQFIDYSFCIILGYLLNYWAMMRFVGTDSH